MVDGVSLGFIMPPFAGLIWTLSITIKEEICDGPLIASEVSEAWLLCPWQRQRKTLQSVVTHRFYATSGRLHSRYQEEHEKGWIKWIDDLEKNGLSPALTVVPLPSLAREYF